MKIKMKQKQCVRKMDLDGKWGCKCHKDRDGGNFMRSKGVVILSSGFFQMAAYQDGFIQVITSECLLN